LFDARRHARSPAFAHPRRPSSTREFTASAHRFAERRESGRLVPDTLQRSITDIKVNPFPNCLTTLVVKNYRSANGLTIEPLIQVYRSHRGL
jgi:hypothetical protein